MHLCRSLYVFFQLYPCARVLQYSQWIYNKCFRAIFEVLVCTLSSFKGKETEVQRALRKKYCEIRDHATVKKVLPYLYQGSVISQEEKQNIEKALENQGNISACGQLIDKVMLKGDKHIKTFISLLPESLQKAFDEELKHPTSGKINLLY